MLQNDFNHFYLFLLKFLLLKEELLESKLNVFLVVRGEIVYKKNPKIERRLFIPDSRV